MNFQIDNSVAALTISAPLNNQIFGFSLNDIVFTYSTSDVDIAKYWVQRDSETEVDNSTNTTYTFSNLVPGTYTLKVKATDNEDNNSAVASVSITVQTQASGGTYCGDTTCNGTETAATCPADCHAVCGDTACTHTESKETCPSDCGPTQVCGDETCDDPEEDYTNCPQDCEAPIEPKPPDNGGDNGNGQLPPPPEITCDDLDCNDDNPCTSDSCEDARCLSIPMSDNTKCGEEMVCMQGQCVSENVPIIPGETGDNTLLVGAAIVAVLAVVGYLFYFR